MDTSIVSFLINCNAIIFLTIWSAGIMKPWSQNQSKIQCRFALLSFYSILIGWLKFPANQRSVNLSWNYLYKNGPTWPLSLHIALFEHLNHHRRSSRPHFRLSQLHVASRPLSKLKIYCVKSIRQKSSNLALPISLLLRSRNSSSSDIRRGLVKNLQV